LEFFWEALGPLAWLLLLFYWLFGARKEIKIQRQKQKLNLNLQLKNKS